MRKMLFLAAVLAGGCAPQAAQVAATSYESQVAACDGIRARIAELRREKAAEIDSLRASYRTLKDLKAEEEAEQCLTLIARMTMDYDRRIAEQEGFLQQHLATAVPRSSP